MDSSTMAQVFFEEDHAAVAASGNERSRHAKVTVVGVGSVGMACAYSILTQHLVGEVVLCDVDRDKLEGEVLDLQHAASFLPSKIVAADADYTQTKHSDICIITAGARQRKGETRLDLVGKNVEIFKQIVPKLVKHSPNTLLLVVSNPVDILAHIAWKLSGLPSSRVIGSGTYLDSSRFRALLSKQLGVNARSVHGWIIGEHGDSSVPVWSGLNVAGVPLKAEKGHGEEEWAALHRKVVHAAYDVINLKGCTNWAIGSAVASIVGSIIRDDRNVVPVSTLVRGCHGIEHEVYLSLPVVIGRNGVDRVVRQPLSDSETTMLRKSAETLYEILVQQGL